MNNRSVGILGLGCYVPETIMTNKRLEEMMDTSDEWIIDRTGIRERRVALAEQATSDLAVEAAKRALDDAKVLPNEIDLIIVATVTPDMPFPSVACIVQDRLKAEKAAAFDITAVCSGFVYGLSIGNAFIQAGIYQKVLVIGAETLSKITDWSDRNTAILFGDGAGAAVLGETTKGNGILGIHLGADGSGGDLLKVPAGGSRQPASSETIVGRQHYISMNGNEVFKFAVKVMGEAATKALENAKLSPADIAYLVPHQANIRIIQSAAKRLRLPLERVIVNVDRYGNTSAASIPLALEEGVASGKIKNGDVVVLVGFGGGLTWGAVVLRWNKEV